VKSAHKRKMKQMKRLLIGLFLLTSYFAKAQEKMFAESNGKQGYIAHTVTAGQTYYSIATKYGLKANDLIAFNKADVKKGVSVGATVKVPLTAANLMQTSAEGLIPIYYKLKTKEGLFRVGTMFGNVKTDVLKKNNALATDAVSVGQDVVVGYLKMAGAPAPNMTNEKREEVMDHAEFDSSKMKKENPIVNVPPTKKEEKPAPPINVKEDRNEHKGFKPSVGYFEEAFAAATGNETKSSGNAAIFKSTSGWEDKKYYALMNNVTPGTIVKIIAGDKYVYAKVLDKLPEMKQNEGLLLRMSNAAAASLGTATDKFFVSIAYKQ
jgi:murein DD-endopeptidase MepM/ murein hydrolase activator NlpD